MRIAGYEVRLLTGNVKHAVVTAAGIGLWLFVGYVVGSAVARFTPYSIADPWPRPLGLAIAGTALIFMFAVFTIGIAAVVGYFVAIEEVRA